MKRRWFGLGVFGVFGLAVVVVVGGSGFNARPAGQPVVTEEVAGAAKLVAFDSCETALDQLRDAARPLVGPYGLGGGDVMTMTDGAVPAAGTAKEAAPQAPAQDHSATNNHETGADEPDLVKTDGRRLITVAGGRLRVLDIATRAITSTVDLPGGEATDLLLDGDRALAMTSASMVMPYLDRPQSLTNRSSLTMIDLAGPAKVVGTLAVDGQYLDARQVGGRARIVVRSAPRLGFVYPQDFRSPSEAQAENSAVVENSPIDDWLPRYRLDNGGTHQEGRLVDCARISHPAVYSGTSMLTVLTIEMSGALGTGDPVSIAADGNTVYGTGSSLYIADDHQLMMGSPGRRVDPGPAQQTTDIHQFDISGAGPPRHVASGTVEGSLLNQYSLSEHAGHLRVATTMATESAVTVLTRKGNELTQVGRLGGLGRTERIYAVRFFGPLGYVVTFRQTDPLYTVDLSDPAKPRAVGELKITGYSAYLHNAGDGTLIGVGQEADERGRTSGAQISLFDVRDAAAPRRAAQYLVDGAYSEVESDPHAFLFWPRTGLVVVPVRGPSGTADALALRLSDSGFTAIGTVGHPADVRRSLVIGDDLWTVSSSGVKVNESAGLKQLAWLPF
ncbi:MAG: hypothetical protein QOI21_1973 [Actinomycetota bacterium]|jgi:uncharacterized secreted protein with C-terminal beta-propeller domain|nr:hypothetical protein [Actinomycetota bacterium]